MKKLILILVLIIPFGFLVNAQERDDNPQMFGSKRDTPQYNVHDFEDVTAVVKHEFSVKNLTPGDLFVVGFEAPEGFDVEIVTETIPTRTLGSFIVSVNPELVPKGDFETEIIIKTEQNNSLGKTTKNFTYTVRGTIQ